MSDIMLKHLVELQYALNQEGVDFVLGGGMSLYVRQNYLEHKKSLRYPFAIASRSTQDIDVFLDSDVIVSSKKINTLKAVLNKLGYQASKEAQYFQFIKAVDLLGQRHVIKVDLLAAPPKEADIHRVKINRPRIRPKDSKNIHAYLTDEAMAINFEKIPVRIADAETGTVTVFISSAYNFLILKLYAFDDRKDRHEPKSDYGRYHAFDIFATICRMTEEDWKVADKHYKKERGCDYLVKACKIRERNFSKLTDTGIIRLKENNNYKEQKNDFDSSIDEFLKDLKDLFPIYT